MSRRAATTAAAGHPDRARLRTRRRRRRLLRATVRGVFWALVLGGVFVLGLGYGATLAGEDELSREEVTVARDPVTVEATLPTETVTVTRTVRAPARSRSGQRSSGTD